MKLSNSNTLLRSNQSPFQQVNSPTGGTVNLVSPRSPRQSRSAKLKQSLSQSGKKRSNSATQRNDVFE